MTSDRPSTDAAGADAADAEILAQARRRAQALLEALRRQADELRAFPGYDDPCGLAAIASVDAAASLLQSIDRALVEQRPPEPPR